LRWKAYTYLCDTKNDFAISWKKCVKKVSLSQGYLVFNHIHSLILKLKIRIGISNSNSKELLLEVNASFLFKYLVKIVRILKNKVNSELE
jgi:hypothetical protein